MIGYLNWQAPLWRDESRTTKYFDIPLFGRFEVLSPISVNGMWQIEYISNGKTVTGWLQDKYMEHYVQTLPSNVVDIAALQTPEVNDAAQYIIWDGFKQTNMCGELCVAQIMKVPLIDVLAKWKTVDLPFYRRIFKATAKATGTGAEDLVKMLGLMGQTSRLINLQKYTPRIFSEIVKANKGVIVSTHLNTITGALNGGGVLHWVNVLEVVVERMDMGWVRVYNPYSNGEEIYSFREFLLTTRAPYGVIV